jgi:hypothetical protein
MHYGRKENVMGNVFEPVTYGQAVVTAGGLVLVGIIFWMIFGDRIWNWPPKYKANR